MSARHDLIIVGGGAAGTAAALEAGAAGLDVVLVELGRSRRSAEADICLAELLAQRPLAGAPAERQAEGWAAAVRRAGEAAAAAADRRDRRLRAAGVARVGGRARLTDREGEVRLEASSLRASHVLLATGSRPGLPAGCEVEEGVLSERSLLFDLEKVPARVLVVGGGLEAVGLASLLSAGGATVELVSSEPRLLSAADPDLSSAVSRALEVHGVRIHLDCRLRALSRRDGGITARVEGRFAGELEAELALAACGRTPDRTGCGLEAVRPAVPDRLPEQVSSAGRGDLHLAGTVTGREMVPEAAIREGRAVVWRILGRRAHVPHAAVPKLVAGVAGCGWSGWTEPGARAAGHALLVGRAQLPGSGRLRPGFVKVLADSSSKRVLGVHAAGPQAREAVLLGAYAVETGASLHDLAELAFPEDSAAAALLEAFGKVEPA